MDPFHSAVSDVAIVRVAASFSFAEIVQSGALVLALLEREISWQDIVGAAALLVVVITVLYLIREILYGGRDYWD